MSPVVLRLQPLWFFSLLQSEVQTMDVNIRPSDALQRADVTRNVRTTTEDGLHSARGPAECGAKNRKQRNKPGNTPEKVVNELKH